MLKFVEKGIYKFYADMDENSLNLTRFHMGKCISSPVQLSVDIFEECMDFCRRYKPNGKTIDYTSVSHFKKFNTFDLLLELQKIILYKLKNEEKFCFFVNLYRVLDIHINVLLIDPANTKDMTNRKGYCIGGRNYSLADILHGILRANKIAPTCQLQQFENDDPRKDNMVIFDPRVHFILLSNCEKALTPDNMDEILNDSCRSYILENTTIQNNKIKLPFHFKLYKADYGDTDDDVLNFIKQYLPKDIIQIIDTEKPNVDYDPSLI